MTFPVKDLVMASMSSKLSLVAIFGGITGGESDFCSAGAPAPPDGILEGNSSSSLVADLMPSKISIMCS